MARGKSRWLRGVTIQADNGSITIKLAKEWLGSVFLRIIVISLSVLASYMTYTTLIEKAAQITIDFKTIIASWITLGGSGLAYLRYFRESAKENTYLKNAIPWVYWVTLITVLVGGGGALGIYRVGIKAFNWVFVFIVLFAGGFTSLISLAAVGVSLAGGNERTQNREDSKSPIN